MNQMRAILLILCFYLSGISSMVGREAMPLAELGKLDLSEWDFTENGTIKLSGAWAFYWNELLLPEDFKNPLPPTSYPEFPSLWSNIAFQGEKLPNQGFATYHLKVKLPHNTPILAIKIPDTYSNYKLWLNGQLISKNGEVGSNKKSSIPYWLPFTKTLSTSSSELELILQVSNFHHGKGGVGQEIYLGESAKMKEARENELILDFISAGSLFMGGLFLLGLYFFSRHDKAILYFGLFCLVYGYREISTGLQFLTIVTPWINWWIRIKLEYIDLYLCIGFFGRFVYYLFPKDVSKKAAKGLMYVTIGVCAISLFLPPIVITSIHNFYLMGLMALFIPYIIYIFVLANLKNREGAKYTFVGLVSLFSATFINLAEYFNLISPMPVLVFILFLTFIFSLCLILSNRFAIILKRAAEAAESGAKSKAEFLATMSHEIRTPMNGVIGMTTLLSQTKLSKEQNTYVDTIRLSGENLITIINDILDFSKIESGKMELEQLPFEIEAAIESVFDLHYSKANKKGLHLYYKIMHDVPKEVVGDVTRIKQVLINLMSNAIKFTNKGNVFVKVLKKSENKSTVTLQFNVEDTGVGIAKEKLNELFERFSQVETFITRKHGGTGLGLAISKKLVQIMDGKIWVKSKESKGSTFSFTVSLDKIQKNGENPTIAQIPQLQGKSILLFTENMGLKEVLTGQLANLDVYLEVVKSADDIKNYFLNKKYELVLIDNDFTTQPANEIEFAIRTFPLTKNLPVIVLNIPHQSVSGINQHVHTYFINRPFKASVFRHTLKNVYSKEVRKPVLNGKKNGHAIQLSKRIPLNILIAEDHAINQRLVLHLLKKQGYVADAVGNGKEALEAIERQNYDIILMDVQMPEMDGLEATKHIVKRFPNGSRPIIIAMTANAMQGDKQMCIDAGMDDYISKPLKAGILEEKISVWGQKTAKFKESVH